MTPGAGRAARLFEFVVAVAVGVTCTSLLQGDVVSSAPFDWATAPFNPFNQTPHDRRPWSHPALRDMAVAAGAEKWSVARVEDQIEDTSTTGHLAQDEQFDWATASFSPFNETPHEKRSWSHPVLRSMAESSYSAADLEQRVGGAHAVGEEELKQDSVATQHFDWTTSSPSEFNQTPHTRRPWSNSTMVATAIVGSHWRL